MRVILTVIQGKQKEELWLGNTLLFNTARRRGFDVCVCVELKSGEKQTPSSRIIPGSTTTWRRARGVSLCDTTITQFFGFNFYLKHNRGRNIASYENTINFYTITLINHNLKEFLQVVCHVLRWSSSPVVEKRYIANTHLSIQTLKVWPSSHGWEIYDLCHCIWFVHNLFCVCGGGSLFAETILLLSSANGRMRCRFPLLCIPIRYHTLAPLYVT